MYSIAVVCLNSAGSVVVLSSLDFDWNDLTDSLKKNKTLPERDNIYAYIKNKIESSNVEFLKGAKANTQLVPKEGVCLRHSHFIKL